MRGSLFLALLFVVTAQYGWAQEPKKDPSDTAFISGEKQIVEIESYSKRYDPRKALMFSAVFPGAGQFYNKKYWKMPLVYGGFAGLIYVANAYQKLNIKYRGQLFDIINDPTSGGLGPTGLTKDQIRKIVDKTRRQRDYFIIMNGLWYLLQMVDAHVDAHLKEFSLNPKMQVSLEPLIENSLMTGRNSGVSLVIKF